MDDTKRGVLVNRMGAFVAVPITFINDERITNTGRCLYMLLSSYTSAKSDDQIAFPSYQTIMKRLGWGSTQTVATALLNLMQHGWVERARRYGSSSVYTINYAPSADPLKIKLRESKDHDFENQNTDTLKSAHYPEVPKQEVPQQEVAAKQRPNLDALAQAAGLDKMPPARRLSEKAKRKSADERMQELEGMPAVKVHREVLGMQPLTLAQMEEIVEGVNGSSETTWRTFLENYKKGRRRDNNQPWNMANVEAQLRGHASYAALVAVTPKAQQAHIAYTVEEYDV